MNGIEKITDRISTDTGKEIAGLTERSQAEARRIHESYAQIAESEYQGAVERGQAAADERVVRLAGVAALEAKKLILAAKQEMLGAAFDRALSQLCALPGEQYVSLLARLAADGSETGKEALLFSPADRTRYGKQVVLAANALLEQRGQTAGMTLSESSRPIRGGLYLQNGPIETNCTFETIVRQLREQCAGEVAKLLFD